MAEDGFNARQLREAILALSESGDWEVAKREWSLVEVYQADEPETCLCGHTPIIEVCVLRNSPNSRVAEVGNVCVKKFLGIRSDLVFAALKRVSEDIDKALNEEAIVFFRRKGILNDWEYEFYSSTGSKRAPSEKQAQTRVRINRKVLASLRRGGFTGR